MKSVILSVLLFSASSTIALCEVEYGKWDSSSGVVIVEKDITTEKYPLHYISLYAQDTSDNAGDLILRCRNNKTEVYYTASSYEFFGAGRKPEIYNKYPSQTESQKISASRSSSNDAAFINGAIGFIAKLVNEGEVVLSGRYYSGSFAAKYYLDENTVDAIYDMATTCSWRGKLPDKSSLLYLLEYNKSEPEGENFSDSKKYNIREGYILPTSFSLEWGQSIEDFKKNFQIDEIKEEGDFTFATIERGDFLPGNTNFLYVSFHEKFGLIKFLWASDGFTSDVLGLNGKREFDVLANILREKYGFSEEKINYVGRVMWEKEDEFYQCLNYEGCGAWIAFWGNEKSTATLELKGTQRGSGYLQLIVEHPDWYNALDLKSNNDADKF